MPDGGPYKTGVIGWPVAHSLSPALHNYWIKQHKLNATYEAIAVKPELLGESLKEMAGSFHGLNVTIPHKQNALAYLNSMDETAQTLGAVNTLTAKNNTWQGSNTDMYGFSAHLSASASLEHKGHACVLGAGGAAQSVVLALRELGFEKITVTNRTAERAQRLAEKFSVTVVPWEQKTAALEGCDLLVNTTSLGMKGNDALVLDISIMPAHAVVVDIVYNPLVTPLLKQAQSLGHQTVDGLGMLMHQAAKSFHMWLGILPEVNETVREYLVKRL